MRPFLPIICSIFLATLISSCQKDNKAPAATSTPALATKFRSTALSVPLSQSITQGVIDYYPFHGNATDASGHHHDGLALSVGFPPDYAGNGTPPTLVKNKYGVANDAYMFDGLSDEIDVDPIFDPKKPVTQFSFYVRYKSDGNGTLLNSGDGYDPFDPYFALRTSPYGIVFTWSDYFNADGTIQASVNTGPLPAKRVFWNDVVVNYSNSTLTVYLNGTLLATTKTTFPTPAHFGSDLLIGDEQIRYPSNFFNSAIDEVSVYNRPLTTDEIAYLYAH
jgi:concanavalin A-like lectin/glucanase superfamily protein